MSETEPNSPLSWRDVYKAVGESEQRVVAAIQAAVAPLSQTQMDHETRLRAAEALAAQVPILKVEETAVALRVTALEAHAQREQGVFATFGATRNFVLAMAAVAGPVLALVALIVK